MRGNSEIVEIFRGKALTLGAVNSFSSEFPLGEGWERIILRLNNTFTNTTGTTPLAEGELRIVKAVRFRTDRNEIPFNGVPGRALYREDQFKSGTSAVKDAIAVAAGTYRMDLPLWFIDPLAKRPEDTILDTARYRSVQLDIQMGTVADLLGVVGDSAASYTLDCYVVRQRGRLPEKGRPIVLLERGIVQPTNPANQTYFDLERASDLAYKRLMLFTTNSASAGVSHTGNAASNVISELTLETDRSFPFKAVLADIINRRNKQDYGLEAVVTGQYILDLINGGSNMSALYSGEHSRLRASWVNDTLSTSQVSCMYEAIRDLKA